MQAIELPLPDSSIFKAYDVRGIVDRTLTYASVRAIGAALGWQLAIDGGAERGAHALV